MVKQSEKEHVEKVPTKTGGKGPVSMFEEAWHPLVRLRAEMDGSRKIRGGSRCCPTC
jgi:hypothetical protein